MAACRVEHQNRLIAGKMLQRISQRLQHFAHDGQRVPSSFLAQKNNIWRLGDRCGLRESQCEFVMVVDNELRQLRLRSTVVANHSHMNDSSTSFTAGYLRFCCRPCNNVAPATLERIRNGCLVEVDQKWQFAKWNPCQQIINPGEMAPNLEHENDTANDKRTPFLSTR